MNETRFAVKVGLFVAAGLVLVAVLLLAFSKGLSLFTPTYQLKLKAASVGGLKSGANALLSGVVVGNVAGAEVAPDGKGVIIRLNIHQRYQIHADARFAIEQIGFLGDQFVAIYPQKNEGPILKNDDEVSCEEPLNLQEVVRSATSLIQQANRSLKILNDAVARVDRTVLSEQTLTNVSEALSKFRHISDRVDQMVNNVDKLVQTNSPPVSESISNLVRFSEDLDKLADEMNATVITNRFELTKAVKNLQTATAVLERLANDVEAGRGLAGSLVKDQQLKFNISATASNFVVLSSNLNNFIGNINKYGLLYKPKQPKTNPVSPPIYPGRSPFN